MIPKQNAEQTPWIQDDSKLLSLILDEMGKVIVGQHTMNRSLLLGLICGGHVLLEGLPGLAKTLAVKTLASVLDAKFNRIQFTPDLLPSDLIGTMIYDHENRNFTPKKGPIFTNLLLADEINRAPAKVQSALLEAMAESQVTLGDSTYPLEKLFLVLATQNPIEQDGTYDLPEAQLDRFLFKVKVGYPTREEERGILDRMSVHSGAQPTVGKVCSIDTLLKIRPHVDQIYADDRIKEYILRLVAATRPTSILTAAEANANLLAHTRKSIHLGASPRATLFITKAARALALFNGRHFVTPDDVKTVAPDILRHRLILTFDAEAKSQSTDTVLQQLLEAVNVP